MKVVITGTSTGMGLACAKKFLSEGHKVHGIDILPPHKDLQSIFDYTHYIANVAHFDELPFIDDVNVLVNNAGVQGSGMDIDMTLPYAKV